MINTCLPCFISLDILYARKSYTRVANETVLSDSQGTIPTTHDRTNNM